MKLHIFGASGTGVSTLGEALSHALQVPYFDSDTYYWEQSDPPFTVRRPAQTRDAALAHDLGLAASWILGGSVGAWGQRWLAQAELVLFLWLPPALRLTRLQASALRRGYTARPGAGRAGAGIPGLGGGLRR